MDSGLWWLVAAVAVAAVAGSVAAVASHRARRRLEADLADSREELAAVQQRLDGLARSMAAPVRAEPHEFVITTAGESSPDTPVHVPQAAVPSTPLDARAFASVALGESLVTLVALGHGLRRALAAENRNRIAFEMRREVRRSRKRRKRDVKEAKRHLRAQALREDAA
jgi:CTP:molybdopterin cytidylyltransferase MocA